VEWYVRVKYKKYKSGYVISIGLDPVKHYNTPPIPVAIFYNGEVMDPSLYAVLGEYTEGIENADNAIYVKPGDLKETLDKVKAFYDEFGRLTGETIHVEVIDIDAIPKKPPHIRKLNILEELGLKRPHE